MEYLIIQLLWGTGRLSFTRFEPYSPSGRVFSFKGMRTWGQSKISSCCLYAWCKSKEMGRRESPRLYNDGELLHTPSSYRKLLDRGTFRILLNINNGAPLWKYVECL